jgi:hypothetical protein
MTGLADARPDAVDLLLRPATTIPVTLEGWPTGSLAGRTFTSTLAGEALDVTVVGDTIVVEADATLTGTLDVGVPVAWQLLEEIDGTPEPILIGTWTPDDGPRAVTSTTVQVAVGAVTVTVTVSSAQASIAVLDARVDQAETDIAAHEALDVAHGWVDDGSTLLGPTIRWPGVIHTAHDAKYWWPPDLVGSAQYVANGATLFTPGYWAFDAAAVEHIKWLWVPGDGWEAYRIRIGIVNPPIASGNAVWRYREERFIAGQPAPDGTVTNTPTTVATQTFAAPAALGAGNFYGDLAADVAAPTAIGEVILSTIERVATDAADTHPGDLGIYVVTATRA